MTAEDFLKVKKKLLRHLRVVVFGVWNPHLMLSRECSKQL